MGLPLANVFIQSTSRRAAGSLISESPWPMGFPWLAKCCKRLFTFKPVKICILTELLVRSVL
ncbi:unnamed protein product [Brassica rapa subsp. narinosa]|uniref:(rape) hypothetical protein n=1 Tax=Brassica napus TaxID=3708 RepID=A0A816PLV3_BRANA|nr:unnamed protein product [Brassica napus]